VEEARASLTNFSTLALYSSGRFSCMKAKIFCIPTACFGVHSAHCPRMAPGILGFNHLPTVIVVERKRSFRILHNGKRYLKL